MNQLNRQFSLMAGCAAFIATSWPAFGLPLTTVRVASGLHDPVHAAHAPGDFDHLFVAERGGVVRMVDLKNNLLLDAPLLHAADLIAQPADDGVEWGLYRIAFDADYEHNGILYVVYFDRDRQTAVARFQVHEVPSETTAGIVSPLAQVYGLRPIPNGDWLEGQPLLQDLLQKHPDLSNVSLGQAYEGCAMPELDGAYFVAEAGTRRIWTALHKGDAFGEVRDRSTELTAPNVTITSIAADAYGEMYLIANGPGGGEIHRIVPDGELLTDCNDDGLEDACNLVDGTMRDADGNGMPEECEAVGANIIGLKSWRWHGTADLIELSLDLFHETNSIEPRRDGVEKLEFKFSEAINGDTVACNNLFVQCTPPGLACTNAALLQDGQSVMVELMGDTGGNSCCEIGFPDFRTAAGGTIDGTWYVYDFEADFNFDGRITGLDAALVKPFLGRIAGVDKFHPKWDYDTSGAVTGSDVLLKKPKLGNITQSCE